MYVLRVHSCYGAVGAKMNASQLSQPQEKRKPIGKITGLFVGLLMIASVVYHTLRWQDQ